MNLLTTYAGSMMEGFLPAIGIKNDPAHVFLLLSQIVVTFVISLFNFVANSLWTFSEDVNRRSRSS